MGLIPIRRKGGNPYEAKYKIHSPRKTVCGEGWSSSKYFIGDPSKMSSPT
jgi:hypothetical protein